MSYSNRTQIEAMEEFFHSIWALEGVGYVYVLRVGHRLDKRLEPFSDETDKWIRKANAEGALENDGIGLLFLAENLDVSYRDMEKALDNQILVSHIVHLIDAMCLSGIDMAGLQYVLIPGISWRFSALDEFVALFRNVSNRILNVYDSSISGEWDNLLIYDADRKYTRLNIPTPAEYVEYCKIEWEQKLISRINRKIIERYSSYICDYAKFGKNLNLATYGTAVADMIGLISGRDNTAYAASLQEATDIINTARKKTGRRSERFRLWDAYYTNLFADTKEINAGLAELFSDAMNTIRVANDIMRIFETYHREHLDSENYDGFLNACETFRDNGGDALISAYLDDGLSVEDILGGMRRN